MSLWPDTPERPYGRSAFGGARPAYTLDDVRLVPPLHLPDRLADVARLGREPTPWDVSTATLLGGLPASLPLVVPAMGSTPVAHLHGVALARAAGRAGVPLVLGENIATVWGYDEPQHPGVPTWKDRALAYLTSLPDADGADAEGGGAAGDGNGDGGRAGHDAGLPPGGLVVQQSVEDAMDELWWRLYGDADLEPYIAAGRIGLEIKVGQGAKPGLGGITLVGPDDAGRLGKDYALGDATRPDGRRERFSAPGTFTTDILEAQVRHLQNDFPNARTWVKLPPARDALELAEAAARGGADLVTLDGAEAGTAVAPSVFLDHVGLPTLAMAAAMRRRPPGCDVLLSGGLRHGADLVKAVALGAAGGALGRAPLEAVIVEGEAGADRWFQERIEEVRHLVYALGHLDATDVDDADVQALDPDVADALGVPWVFDTEAGVEVAAPHAGDL